ncbi:MAG: preprotein translocase subunit SecA [Clostridia bacterium]|jgi:preprotein translocase subunit SecA|nr:preprotein translocase subunit SecA [Clostridia bacterium]MCI1999952.1 preprotein translocase subunit SecA [Clostridia bacterium]MCI2014514.1 preprotein translocase subunit SecA [Clostridia bacterium]
MGLIEKIFGNYSEKEIKKINPIVDKVLSYSDAMEKLTDDELRAKTDEFKERYKKGETLDDLLPEAYAAVREGAGRSVGMKPFRVQVIGGVVMHQGRIAEMKTGEGKTLVATLPAYLNAITGGGVHVVTVNDYLAKRDSEWMGQVYKFMGLTVGVILNGMDNEERREMYNCDITYGTNNEYGFDYLRDNMVVRKEQMVQRGLNFAIIDEVDSVLIDEARTPLIISGSGTKSTQLYEVADRFSKSLIKGRIVNEEEALNPIIKEEMVEEGDFVVDEKSKTVNLTQQGVEKAERFFKLENLSDPENLEILHHINNALKANYQMALDKDYVIKDGEVMIVDEFTGRIMPGRRYSDGLHQAIEAKEGVEVRRESRTLATITFQNFFNKYKKKCGMTGTAQTEESEFRNIYGMDVIVIPTNLPICRKDLTDIVYKTEEAKFRAVANDIEKTHAAGQPVLVGTITIEKSEKLSNLLRKRGIPHQVLNAKFHEKEAEIVALAGQKGAVTIATNMAGRGTDIKLGEGVKELGGLKIIGTERHESRRIDNQLRGRSGRQGDPGESRFYISLEDDLMRLFGGDKTKKIVDTLGIEEDEPIEHGMLGKAIENAQKKVEGNNFATRKHLLEYDEVMNEQREIIYGERKRVLFGENLRDSVLSMIKSIITHAAEVYVGEIEFPEDWDMNGFNEYLGNIMPMPPVKLTDEDLKTMNKATLIDETYERAVKLYEAKEDEINATDETGTEERMREIERVVMLRVIDSKWMDHIDDMDQMRQGIGLHAYAQRDPLIEYKYISYDMFNELSFNIQLETVRGLFHVRIVSQPVREEVQKPMFTNKDDTSKAMPKQRKKAKVGRNDPCPCGSGKKYKYCCGRDE